MFPYLQRSLYQVLTLNSSNDSNDETNNTSTVAATIDNEHTLNRPEIIVAETESETVAHKSITVDSSNETSSSGSTENDFEIVSNESSPIASPTTIMAEHDEPCPGISDEAEDSDKFTKQIPKGVSEMEWREKRQRLRYEI